jgi:hypothetical protein
VCSQVYCALHFAGGSGQRGQEVGASDGQSGAEATRVRGTCEDRQRYKGAGLYDQIRAPDCGLHIDCRLQCRCCEFRVGPILPTNVAPYSNSSACLAPAGFAWRFIAELTYVFRGDCLRLHVHPPPCLIRRHDKLGWTQAKQQVLVRLTAPDVSTHKLVVAVACFPQVSVRFRATVQYRSQTYSAQAKGQKRRGACITFYPC